MASGDGLLVRVRITGGIVGAGTFADLAGLARRHGNGLVDLSQRANLQIRGVGDGALDAVIADLDRLGLLDGDPDAESVRNVIGPPLAGLDPSAKADGRALVAGLEARLSAEPELHALPDKFGFLVDDGGSLSLDDVATDIRLVADGTGIRLALGGDRATAVPVARVREAEAIDAAIALARAFLEFRPRTGARRMRALVADVGASSVAGAAGLTATSALPAAARAPVRPVGVGPGYIGVAAPFGRFTADQMERIAAEARGEIRLTPWRLVLLPGTGADALARLRDHGLITDPDDPRRAVVACPGRPDCPSGAIDTRTIAATLAPLAAGHADVALHVSGCPKGCARPWPTAVTLVGRDGRLDLVVGGRADAPPAATGLDAATAADAVRAQLGRRKDQG
jgi:precorrin-3B synthase